MRRLPSQELVRHIISCDTHKFEERYLVEGSLPGRCQSRSDRKMFFCKKIDFASEYRALCDCASDSVVKVVETFPEHLVLELLGTDLLEMMRENGEPLLHLEACLIIRDMLRGLVSVHARGYIHGDIKPENFVLSSQSGDLDVDGINVKLIDFDNSRPISERNVNTRGSLAYLAPEYALSQASDIWSVGAVAFLLLTGESLINPAADSDTVSNILKDQEFPARRLAECLKCKVSADIYELVSALLSREPNRRPTAQETLDRLLSLG